MSDQAEAVDINSAAQRYLAATAPSVEQAPPKEAEAPQEVVDEPIEGEIEEYEPEDETEADSEEQLYEVKVNGETFQVPLDELLAGYQKNRDYQQKTQAVAAEREAIKKEREVLSSLGKKLEALDGTVAYLEKTKELLKAAAPVVDQRLVDTNPAMYIRMKEAREAYMSKVAEIDSTINQTRQEAESSLVEARRIGSLTIQQKMPELATAEGAQKLYGYLMENYGYKAENIDANVDANLFILAEKARRYDDIMSRPRKPTPQAAKVQSSKTISRPAGDPRAQQINHVKKQYKETGSIENAAALYLAGKK